MDPPCITGPTYDVAISEETEEAQNELHSIPLLMELRSYPIYVKTLELGEIEWPFMGLVEEYLTPAAGFTWRSLEELTISVLPTPNGVTPAIALRAKLFPVLSKLRLDGVAARDWNAEIFHQLKRVELWNISGSNIDEFVAFTWALSNWGEITELHMHNFLTIQDFDHEYKGVSTLPPKLRTLVIEGPVKQMPEVLYYLDMPDEHRMDVHVLAHSRYRHNDDLRSCFQAVLPFYPHCPSIIRLSSTASVTVTQTEAKIVGTGTNGGRFTISVCDAFEYVPPNPAFPNVPQQPTQRTVFRDAVFALVDAFAMRSAPVDALELAGDAGALSAQDWCEVLQTPLGVALRGITLRDAGDGRGTNALWVALDSAHERNEGEAMCPGLERLSLPLARQPMHALADYTSVGLKGPMRTLIGEDRAPLSFSNRDWTRYSINMAVH